MWLSALLFGSVLELITDQLKAQSADALNTEPVSELVHYQGQEVDFRHQLWRIEAASVCQRATERQACQQAAQALFADSCQRLTADKQQDAQREHLRAMYCAAVKEEEARHSSSQPDKVASSGTATSLEDLYRECKRTTVLAWISKEASKLQARDAACSRYETAKSHPADKKPPAPPKAG